MNDFLNHKLFLLKQELGLYLSISIGIFLFVLFFEPFDIDKLDNNNKLLVEAGLGGIIFIFIVLIRVVLDKLIQSYSQNRLKAILPYTFGNLLIVILSSVAFPFYLRFVGLTNISFYVMFRVVFLCITPALALNISDIIKELKKQNQSLIKERKTIQSQLENYEEDYLNKSIEIISEYKSENFSLLVSELAYIKTADNYVEVVYKEGDSLKKKLIRNTLKNVEQHISPYSNFIRCHRICIVNLHYIEKLNKNYNRTWLTIKGSQEEIPVSRQYLLKVKEAL